MDVAAASITADGDPQHARRAAFPLSTVDPIQHHPAHAVQISPGLQWRVRQFVLRAYVLTAAALEEQVDS